MGEPGAEKTEGPCGNGLPDCAQIGQDTKQSIRPNSI